MASNYSSDHENAPIANPGGLQRGSGSKMSSSSSASPSESQAAALPSTPPVAQAGQIAAANLSLGVGRSQRRLSPDTELSNGRYRIERLVASGGMGAVYRATDLRFSRPCAVKEMLNDFSTQVDRERAVEWFKREANLLHDLHHPSIPHVRDVFSEDGRYYLAMDFVEGRTLDSVLEQDGTIPGLNGARGVTEAQARSWAQQVCNVLAYLHRQTPPIIFRDLKPSNIMVMESGEIRLIDFGIARGLQSQNQATIIMTPGYAPPEQLLGTPEPRSDIYSLGVTLHRVLTHHDASNNTPDIFSFPPVRALRPDVSIAFEQMIMRALALMAPQRWASAAEMERAILNLPPIIVQPPMPPAVASGSNAGASRTPSGPQLGLNGPGGTFIKAAQDHLSAGRIDAAYIAVQQAFGIEPGNALVHKAFGQVFARQVPPAPDRAMQAYDRSLQLNPNDAETHKLVGDILFYFRHQPTVAITAYTRSLTLNPEDPEAHHRLAACLEETRQLESALREHQEAVRIAPKRLEFQHALGLLAQRMNRFPPAERALIQVLMIDPAHHPARFSLSQVYESEGKLELAWRECNFVLSAIPTHQGALAMSQRLRTQLGRR